MLPHLDAAYNLARWLVRDPAAAEDVVQEAMLRALSYFSSFRGVNPRAWLLQIVRNAAYSARERDGGGRSSRSDSTGEAGDDRRGRAGIRGGRPGNGVDQACAATGRCGS